MAIEFVRTVQFTKLLKAGTRLREFNFRKLGGVREGEFSVDTVDERGNRIMFTMKKQDDRWKLLEELIPSLPTWISQNEKLLNDTIETELTHS
jgi:hypothetical protein